MGMEWTWDECGPCRGSGVSSVSGGGSEKAGAGGILHGEFKQTELLKDP